MSETSTSPVRQVVAESAHTGISERRHVSVLFADLVGFTSLSESRDTEEVRDLLPALFQVSRSIVERYGGSVENFIGDAVLPRALPTECRPRNALANIRT